MADKTRSAFLDCTRGLVIFLMLWGHCIQFMIPSGLDFFENSVYRFIYSFHMPCFALISGYLLWYSFNKRDSISSLGKRVIALIIPIVFAHFFNVILNFIPKLILEFSVNTCLAFAKSMLSVSSLWFFWSILASVVAIACAKSISKKIYVQLIFIIFLVPLVYAFPCGGNNVFMYPYVVMGYYFAELKKYFSEKVLHILGYTTIPIHAIMVFFFEKKHYIYTTGLHSSEYSLMQNLSINLFRYAIGLIGSIAFISAIYFISKAFSKIRFFNRKKDFFFGIDLLGQKSLQIYALSCSLLSVYLTRISRLIYDRIPTIENFLKDNILLFNFVVTISVAVVYCIVLYAIIRLLEKIKISKYIYGR